MVIHSRDGLSSNLSCLFIGKSTFAIGDLLEPENQAFKTLRHMVNDQEKQRQMDLILNKRRLPSQR